MREVRFRLLHGCEISELSRRFPDLPLAAWCNWNLEVLEFPTLKGALPPALEEDLAKLGRKGFKRLATHDTESARTIVLRCGHKPGPATVDGLLQEHGALALYPVLYEAGWEHYRCIVFEPEQVAPLFKALARLGQVELLMNREWKEQLLGKAFMVSTDDVLSGLTPKQARALLTAIEEGYYNVPRTVRTEDIARRRKVPRTTFGEHVRKGESKVLLRMAPYIAVYAGTAGPPARAKG